MKKIAVVTSLMGAYESHLSEISHNSDRYDFICYTNIHNMVSNTWDIKATEPLYYNDMARSSYFYKWMAHKHINKKYDIMVWVDASFQHFNIEELDLLVDKFLSMGDDTVLYIEKHPSRDTLSDELSANIILNKDNHETMTNMVGQYFSLGYKDEFTTMVETGFSIRKVFHPKMVELSECLWGELSDDKKSKRDQLIYDYAVWKTNTKDNIALFTFSDKSKVITFKDHPNNPTRKDKVLYVGPFLGEWKYELEWLRTVKEYLSHNIYDKIYIGCSDSGTRLWGSIKQATLVYFDNSGEKNGIFLNGSVPTWGIQGNSTTVNLRPTQLWMDSVSPYVNDIRRNKYKSVNVYYSYYVDKNHSRNDELKFCLNKLISNPNIDKIYLLCDSDMYVSSNKKCCPIKMPSRPTYKDIMSISEKMSGDDDVNIIINSDCFIDDIGVQKIEETIGRDDFYCISRKELVDSSSYLWRREIQCSGSQDAWVFVGKKRPIQQSDFTMGVPGCDHRIAYLAQASGYAVKNPSVDVVVYHYHTTNIRSYSVSDMLPPPYLMVAPSYSYGKSDTFLVKDFSDTNPLLINYDNYEIVLSLIVTYSVIDEFLLFKKTMERFHKVKWLLSSDEFVADYCSKFDNVESFILVGESGTHRSVEGSEDYLIFKELMRSKVEISKISMNRYGYAFLIDTDMVMFSKFTDEFLINLFHSNYDILLSNHNLLDKELEKKVGVYNAGMVVIKNPNLLNSWGDCYSDDVFFDQKSLEIAISSGNYKIWELPHEYNVAYWRVDNNPKISIGIDNDGVLVIDSVPIVNVHNHLVYDVNGYGFENDNFKQKLMNILPNAKHIDTKEVYDMIALYNEV